VERDHRQVGRLPDDEAVGPDALSQHVSRPQPALQLSHHMREQYFTTQPNADLADGSYRRHVGGVGRLPVGHAASVDEAVVDRPGQGIPGPSLAGRVRVQVTVQHESGSAPGSDEAAQAVEATGLYLLQGNLQSEVAQVLVHEAGDPTLFTAGRV